jgi:hypothetical protein
MAGDWVVGAGMRVGLAIGGSLNRLQREMRNLHGVFGLADLTHFGGDAAEN